MKFEDIKLFAPPNKTNPAKVESLVQSMLDKGWQGAPILTINLGVLLTGAHRLQALKKINRMWWDGELEDMPIVLTQDVAEDVTDIISDYYANTEDTLDTFQYDNLREYFAGTWVEQYAENHKEW